tara:strand:+ start:426 stop:1040 length:615 start_codon:yes stop_codon:yes gene_type:complete
MPGPRIPNNVSDWKSSFRGYVKPSLYEVTFSGTGFANIFNAWRQEFQWDNEDLKKLTVMCEAASFPGEALSTQPNRIYGPVREFAYEKLYSGDLTLTFRMDDVMNIRRFFTSWQAMVARHDTGDFAYYNDYVGEILIYQYPNQQKLPGSSLGNIDNPIYGARVLEAYPKSVGPVEVGYDQRDTYMKQTVDFAFRKWEEIHYLDL